MIRAALLVCAGLSTALLLTGCGGSGPRNATVDPPLTKAAYEAAVQEIVTSVGAEYGHLSTIRRPSRRSSWRRSSAGSASSPAGSRP